MSEDGPAFSLAKGFGALKVTLFGLLSYHTLQTRGFEVHRGHASSLSWTSITYRSIYLERCLSIMDSWEDDLLALAEGAPEPKKKKKDKKKRKRE